ncbi:MAG: CRISPR-associated endoribonuclease Cas6 [Pseudonocardiaceae bacterium]
MRLRLEVRTSAEQLPWREVLRPGRGFAYGLLASADPELGTRLHSEGWGVHRMGPFGHGAPVFPLARRRPGVYAMGGRGSVELGSPLPAVVQAWATSLAVHRVVDWGGVAFQVEGVHVVEPPSFTSGYARLRTTTPVVMKGSGRDSDGRRTTRQAWLLPAESEFPVYLTGNLRRKAETLDLDPDVTLERITWIGAKRSYAVSDGYKTGAPVEVELRAAPETLQALWSWGLGQSNSAGFGWVAA